MSPKLKDEWLSPIRVDAGLKKETHECAKTVDEYISDYIREAVKTRNKKVKKGGVR